MRAHRWGADDEAGCQEQSAPGRTAGAPRARIQHRFRVIRLEARSLQPAAGAFLRFLGAAD